MTRVAEQPVEAARVARPNPIARVLKILGPGLITSASDHDPSGIGTYAVAGASLGYATLWTALLSFPMMTAVQYTCAKIGMVSGTGLAAVLRQRFPRPLVYLAVFALVLANTINGGADLGAIAAAINLLVPIPLTVLIVPIGVAILALQIWGSYKIIVGCFTWLTLGLLAYVGAALFAHPHWSAVLAGTFLPRLSLEPGYVAALVAIFGTTISPYMFFWQPSEEVEEEIDRWTAVLNGFLAPPLLVLVMLVANDRGIMGSRTNGRWLNFVGWATTAAMFAAALGLVVTWGQ